MGEHLSSFVPQTEDNSSEESGADAGHGTDQTAGNVVSDVDTERHSVESGAFTNIQSTSIETTTSNINLELPAVIQTNMVAGLVLKNDESSTMKETQNECEVDQSKLYSKDVLTEEVILVQCDDDADKEDLLSIESAVQREGEESITGAAVSEITEHINTKDKDKEATIKDEAIIKDEGIIKDNNDEAIIKDECNDNIIMDEALIKEDGIIKDEGNEAIIKDEGIIKVEGREGIIKDEGCEGIIKDEGAEGIVKVEGHKKIIKVEDHEGIITNETHEAVIVDTKADEPAISITTVVSEQTTTEAEVSKLPGGVTEVNEDVKVTQSNPDQVCSNFKQEIITSEEAEGQSEVCDKSQPEVEDESVEMTDQSDSKSELEQLRFLASGGVNIAPQCGESEIVNTCSADCPGDNDSTADSLVEIVALSSTPETDIKEQDEIKRVDKEILSTSDKDVSETVQMEELVISEPFGAITPALEIGTSIPMVKDDNKKLKETNLELFKQSTSELTSKTAQPMASERSRAGGRSYQESRRAKDKGKFGKSETVSATASGIVSTEFDAQACSVVEPKDKGDVLQAIRSLTENSSECGLSGKKTTLQLSGGDAVLMVAPVEVKKDSGAELLSFLTQSSGDKESSKNRSAANRDVEKGSKLSQATDLKSQGIKSVADLEAQWQQEASLNKSKAEEEGVQDEGVDEQKLKEEQEAQRIIDEEKNSLLEFIRETEERITSRIAMREENLKAADNRPDESFFFKLDSNLKKNTAFVKKLKNLTETQKDSLIKDINSLNLTKYIGEAASAIAEAKLKMTDIGCTLVICSLLHQRYAEFAPSLLESWNKVLLNKKDEKVPNASKLRVDLRLFADLVAVGVFTEKEGLPVLANQLTLLTANDKEEHNNLSIIISFCKHCGDDYAGLVPLKFRVLAQKYGMEIARSQVLRVERQKSCRNLIKDYFLSLCKHVVTDCKELRNQDRACRRVLQTRGELSTERKEKLEAAQLSFQKLSQNCSILADLLDEEMPELPEEEVKLEADGLGLNSFNAVKGGEYQSDTDGLFEDEDTRQFYESLPDLKAIIPGILYKDSEHAGATVTIDPASALDEDLEGIEIELLVAEDLSVPKEPVNPSGVGLSAVVTTDNADAPLASGKSKGDEDAGFEVNAVAPDVEDDECEVGSSMKVQVEAYLANLPKCVNRELMDNAAVDFCMNLNTKTNRRKLVRALFFVHRTRYDLLPFYARLVAALNPCMPSVAVDLALMLKGDFKYHVRKKDQINIESKIKTVRFIGELVKFNVFSKTDALQCLKLLMFDFTHHNIEMACSLLETCGRYLYRTAESHHRIKMYLDVMMRKKQVVHLDGRYCTMIENAFYYSNPPESKMEARKVRPPMHDYIRKLLYKDLTKANIERVLRQMRKLNWNDPEIRYYATKRLTAMWNVKYGSIHCCANLLAGLAPYQELVGIQVIDSVLEDIRLGMEINHPKYNQRRVSLIKYLGELYNYRLVESHVIFSTLYSFITFGVSLDESAPPSLLDPPEHLFRIRLSCVLLDTCGQYFDRGSSRKKLDCFLVYFQRYFWHKKRHSIWNAAERPFPMDVEYMLYDVIEALRPKLKICQSFEEAELSANQQDTEFAEKIAEIVKLSDLTALTAIQESEEAESVGHGAESDDDGAGTLSPNHSQSQKDGEDDEEDSLRNLRRGDDEKDDSANEEDDEEEDAVVDNVSGDDEQVAVPTGGLKHIKCVEDDDFLAALDKMMSETMQARTQEIIKILVVDIAVPLSIKSQQKVKPPVLNSLLGLSLDQPRGDGHSQEDENFSGNTIPFTIMSRKGNKQQFTTLNIPMTDTIASKFREQKEVVRAEKERIKKVVLDIHERQEEEDYQEMIAQLNRPLASSGAVRERRSHYQHPKGVPDADVIFGSKYVTKR